MSIELCRCCNYIDTDEDDQAYTVTTEEGDEIALDYALCPNCREQFADMLVVSQKTHQFVLDIFDHVRAIGRIDFLPKLYEFQADIEKKINPKKR